MPSRLLLIAVSASLLAACATTEDVASVSYTAAAAAPAPGAERIQVTVTATDARTTNRGRISTKINGYGMEMAAIRAKEDVADTVRAALSAELKQRGYGLGPGGPTVSAAVETFYSDFSTGMLAGKATGRVQLTLTVTSASGQPLYSRRSSGLSNKSIQLASGANAAAAISMALSEALGTVLNDPDFAKALNGANGAA